MKIQSKIFFGTTVALACTLLASGCAKPHAQAPKTLIQNKGVGAGSGAAANGAYDPSLDGIEGAYKVYGKPEGFSQTDFENIVAKNYPGLIDASAIGYLFDYPADEKQKLTLPEVKKRVPTLTWADQGKAAAYGDLDADLLKSFPAASRAARDGVIALIQRFDVKWTNGKADGKMSQNELLVAGVVLGLVSRDDFSKGMPARFGLTPQLSQLIDSKLNQQLYGRYAVSSYSALPADDLKLEWAQLILREQLVARRLKKYKSGGVTVGDLSDFLVYWDIKNLASDASKWANVFKLYHHAPAAKSATEEKLVATDAFNLLADVSFGKTVSSALEDSVNASGAARHADKVTALAALYPKIGATVLLDAAGHPKAEFWSTLGEGVSELTTVTMQLYAVALDELLFSSYDANHDMLLQKSEAVTALTAMGVSDVKNLDMLYLTAEKAYTPAELFPILSAIESR